MSTKKCYLCYYNLFLQCLFHSLADPCYNYQILSDANRKSSYVTPVHGQLCDKSLPEGWYRFVGAAGTRMPTTRVPAYRCGTDWSGWLDGAHPTVEDGVVNRKVCFTDRTSDCKATKTTSVKNCGSYFIYKFNRHLYVTHATVVQTEWEANILRVVKELTNRSVVTYV